MSYIKAIARYLFKKFLLLSFALLFVSILLVVSLNFINPPIWGWKLQRQINPPENYPVQIQHQWVKWAQLPKNMKLAVIAAEDQLFTQHYGFDFNSIMDALNSNAQGKQIRGASTISQQTAKNLFLWPSKSFLRKGIEAWFTALMEALLNKQRILELYLNLVEFGPGIFGVQAASQHFYKKRIEYISVQEAARLASVLPNPYRFHVNKPSKYIIQRSLWIEKQMRQLGQAALP